MSISVVKNPVTNKYTVAKDIKFKFNDQPITFVADKCYINGKVFSTLTGWDVCTEINPKDK